MLTPIITPEAVAEYFGIRRQTVYLWIKKGQLPAFKMGRKLFVKECDVDTFLEEARIRLDKEGW